MEFVMDLCHRVSVLHRGTAIAEGAPHEVRQNPAVLDAYLGD
jgi:ABC-type branched-subunit amino acid transport system ATPase component